MPLELHPWQREALGALAADERAGLRRLLLVMATGTGKTVTFLAWLARALLSGLPFRALIVAHREELIRQPLHTMERFFPDLHRLAGVVMAGRDEAQAGVVVATVQTLARPHRLERVLATGPFTHLVIDEAHHAVAPSYTAVLEALEQANPGLRVLGVTATPIRTDRDGLIRVFEKASYQFSITRAIRAGALVPFRALGFELPLTLDGVRETADGWAAEPLGDLLSAGNVLEIVYEKWQEHARDLPTIAFTAGVAQAHRLAAYFREQGTPAESGPRLQYPRGAGANPYPRPHRPLPPCLEL